MLTITPALKPMDDDKNVELVVMLNLLNPQQERITKSTQMIPAPMIQARWFLLALRQQRGQQIANARTDSRDAAHHPAPGVIFIEPHGSRCPW
jgi:hypothetical protein